MGPTVTPVVDEGLGNSAYLLDLGDGSALAVDPPRDLRAVRAAADRGCWTRHRSARWRRCRSPTSSSCARAGRWWSTSDRSATTRRCTCPGRLAIPLRDQFATWLGWLADPDR